MSLKGTGGGLYNGVGASNYGVELANAILTAGNGGSTVNTINISGYGGLGSGWESQWREYRHTGFSC